MQGNQSSGGEAAGDVLVDDGVHLGERDALAAAGREEEALAGAGLRVERLERARRRLAGR